MSSFSSILSLSLMSSWLWIVLSVRLSRISRVFPSRFLKCSFHFKSLFSWLTAFTFALEVLFYSFFSFTFWHANCDCLSSTEFLILLMWPWMYSSFSFLVCVTRCRSEHFFVSCRIWSWTGSVCVCVCVCVCVSGFERGWAYPSEVRKKREIKVLLSLEMSDH